MVDSRLVVPHPCHIYYYDTIVEMVFTARRKSIPTRSRGFSKVIPIPEFVKRGGLYWPDLSANKPNLQPWRETEKTT